jgi:hypothetical protein
MKALKNEQEPNSDEEDLPEVKVISIAIRSFDAQSIFLGAFF